jgi:CheY-like chemotaxis protein
LVITKQLIESMGGKIDVSSELETGSTFRVSLPMSTSHHDPSSLTPLPLHSQWSGGRECSVLYVEDDEVNLILVEQMFATQPEWKLHTASTGADGVAQALSLQPDLIMLDMNLPDMTGTDVFKLLARTGALATSAAWPSVRMHCLLESPRSAPWALRTTGRSRLTSTT